MHDRNFIQHDKIRHHLVNAETASVLVVERCKILAQKQLCVRKKRTVQPSLLPARMGVSCIIMFDVSWKESAEPALDIEMSVKSYFVHFVFVIKMAFLK